MEVTYASTSPFFRQKLQNVHCEKQTFVMFTFLSIIHPTESPGTCFLLSSIPRSIRSCRGTLLYRNIASVIVRGSRSRALVNIFSPFNVLNRSDFYPRTLMPALRSILLVRSCAKVNHYRLCEPIFSLTLPFNLFFGDAT
jgi:hypothetical protein